MDSIIGVAIALAIIGFILWLVFMILMIVLYVVIMVPFYTVSGIYAGVKFIAMNIFIGLDKLFYLGFDVPVVAVWVFWGLVIGAAIQGCWEMKIYGRRRIGVLIAVTPILLLVLVGGIKGFTSPQLSNGSASPTTLQSSDPPVPETMVLIPAGEFTMGSNNGSENEKPVHTVYVDAFYMDKYEVTNAEYAAFLNIEGEDTAVSYYIGHRWQGSAEEYHVWRIKYIDGQYYPRPGYENHPVSGVTWYGAMAYAAWVGKRLPTEAEWERAARGGLDAKAYPWGDVIGTGKANYDDVIGYNPGGDTAPVGSYPANGYGLYNMAGNVSEWCLDEYDENFYGTSSRNNPVAGGSLTSIVDNFVNVESARVVRGGNWYYDANMLRCASRYYDKPQGDLAFTFINGFRCVKGVSSSDKE